MSILKKAKLKTLFKTFPRILAYENTRGLTQHTRPSQGAPIEMGIISVISVWLHSGIFQLQIRDCNFGS